jgi:predicted methyltransferase
MTRARSRAALLTSFFVACGGPLPSSPDPTAPTQISPPSPAPTAEATPAAAPRATSDDNERSEADRALDPSRHPVEMLAFFGIAPGQHVAELGAGTGYTTELLARAVGPSGVVYGQNPKWLLEKFAESPWAERLRKPSMKNVRRLDRDFDDPFPPEVKDLDAVISILFYHDTVWLGADRDRMNRAVFAALRSGGVYGIVDYSALATRGIKDVKTIHRIEDAFVKAEVIRAGFKLEGEAAFLRNSADARDWNDAPNAEGERHGTSDRFVLKFVKP